MNELPLRDIHLPSAVSAWPPAIGWWILAALILLIVIAGILFFKHRKNKIPAPAYKKIALKNLHTLQKQFTEQANSIELLRSVSALLRRIALSYLPRESVAGLTGEQWIKQLNTLVNQKAFSNEMGLLLSSAPYRAKAEYNADELLQQCEQWIKELPDKPSTHIDINAEADIKSVAYETAAGTETNATRNENITATKTIEAKIQ